jgi:hypothetical protein
LKPSRALSSSRSRSAGPRWSPAILIISRLPHTAQTTGPAPTDVAPIATEAGYQDGHVDRPEAVAGGAPGADALVGINKVAKSFDGFAGIPQG